MRQTIGETGIELKINRIDNFLVSEMFKDFLKEISNFAKKLSLMLMVQKDVHIYVQW